MIQITPLAGPLVCQPAAPAPEPQDTDFSAVLDAHLKTTRAHERVAPRTDRDARETGHAPRIPTAVAEDRTDAASTATRGAHEPENSSQPVEHADSTQEQPAADAPSQEPEHLDAVEEISADAAALAAIAVLINDVPLPATALVPPVPKPALSDAITLVSGPSAPAELPTLDASAIAGQQPAPSSAPGANSITAQLTELRVVQEAPATQALAVADADTFVSSASAAPSADAAPAPVTAAPATAGAVQEQTTDTLSTTTPLATGNTARTAAAPVPAADRQTPQPASDTAAANTTDDSVVTGAAPAFARTAQASQLSEASATPERVITTENIRSEVWEIAKRAQALSRVEAVIHTTLGDLSVVARHTANGVSVTLGGDAAANLDLSSLQSDLQGLNVSVDQQGAQPRAREWDEDTVSTRTSTRPETTPTTAPTTPIRRAINGQLDVHA